MNKEKKNLLVFGYGLTVIITFFVWRHAVKHGPIGTVSYIFLSLGFLSAIVTTINYRWMKPVYDKWMVGAHFIGSVVSGALLVLLYYFIFTSIGIMMRLSGKDLLDRRIDKNATSYWIRRPIKSFDPKMYTQQF